MGSVHDIKTGKKLIADGAVKEQQAKFSREAALNTLSEVVEVLEEQGYSFRSSVLVMPANDECPPCCVSMTPDAEIGDLIKVVRPALVNLMKVEKMESGKSDEPA